MKTIFLAGLLSVIAICATAQVDIQTNTISTVLVTAPSINATTGFQVNGIALASTNLSDAANIAMLNVTQNLGSNTTLGTQFFMAGSTSGLQTIATQAAAGTSTLQLPNFSSGTYAFAVGPSGTNTVINSGTSAQAAYYNAANTLTSTAALTFGATSKDATVSQLLNGDDILYASRNTDVGPLGNFLHFQTGALADVVLVDVSGNVTQAGNLTIRNPGTAPVVDLSNSNCLGTGCSTTNEFLQFGWDSTNSDFQISTQTGGTGTGRGIEITPKGASPSYVFDTSGNFGNGKMTVGSGGPISKYNNVSTAGIGVPAVIGVADSTGLNNTTSAVTIATPSAAGHYEVRYYLDASTVCTSSTSNWSVTIAWQDASAARSQTSAMLSIGTSQMAGYFLSAATPIYSAASQPITITATRNSSCSAVAKVDVHAEVLWTD